MRADRFGQSLDDVCGRVMTGGPERGRHCLPREPDGERLEIGGRMTAAGHHVNGPRAVPGYRVELTRPPIAFALGLRKRPIL